MIISISIFVVLIVPSVISEMQVSYETRWQFGIAHITKVTLCQAGLVLGWVTIHGCTILVFSQPPWPTHYSARLPCAGSGSCGFLLE